MMRSCSIFIGLIAETNATHVFIVRNGEVATSRVIACPEGITRATVLEICAAEKIPCAETDLKLEEAYCADEVFCTGTMGELAGSHTDRQPGDRRRESRPDDEAIERTLRATHGNRRRAGR